MKRTIWAGACVLIVAASITLSQSGIASAQGPGGGRGPGWGEPIFFGSPLVCSTTNYTEVAATALGLTAAEVRVGLVSGKRLEQLALEQSVEWATVQAALDAAYKADVEKAAQDGIYHEPANVVIAKPSADEIPPDGSVTISIAHVGGGLGLVTPYNEVQPMVVAADALDMSCADLVKAARDGGISVVQVAADKGIQVQTLVDALVKAYQDATAQDVAEGLITEAQATAKNRNLVERVTRMISMPGGMMLGGKFFAEVGAVRIGRPGRGGVIIEDRRSGRPGREGVDGSKQQPTPQAPGADATPEATPDA